MKTIEIDIDEIIIPQKFGYHTIYTKEESIKHKRKKINDINYSTKKMNLVFYSNQFTNSSNFNLCFIYQAEDNKFIRRTFTPMGETFELISEKTVLVHVNTNKTLF